LNTSRLVTHDMSNKVTDCCGNDYQIIRMAGSGFCGFHCLSHCMTGSQLNYADIIDDCMIALSFQTFRSCFILEQTLEFVMMHHWLSVIMVCICMRQFNEWRRDG